MTMVCSSFINRVFCTFTKGRHNRCLGFMPVCMHMDWLWERSKSVWSLVFFLQWSRREVCTQACWFCAQAAQNWGRCISKLFISFSFRLQWHKTHQCLGTNHHQSFVSLFFSNLHYHSWIVCAPDLWQLDHQTFVSIRYIYLALYILIMLILSKYLLIIFDMVADMDKYFAEDFTHSTPHCRFSKGVI